MALANTLSLAENLKAKKLWRSPQLFGFYHTNLLSDMIEIVWQIKY
ncbi:MAG: hypothetical protein LH649_16175 [Pseudanabaena sp. CAN_BIN31]|nr:hypothetical protein [Pseudanabaena sp. CAN_BIN31]